MGVSDYYSDLEKLGVNIDLLRKLDPTEIQLESLRNGLLKLSKQVLMKPIDS
jgi:hypothetical protein